MKQNNIIKGKPLNFNVGIQKWYVKELVKLVDDLTKEVYEEIKPLYKEYKEQITFAQDTKCHPEFISGSNNKKMLKQVQHDSIVQDASITSQTRIRLNSLRELFEKKFKDRGKTFAERMIRKTNRYANTTFWAMMNEMFKTEKKVDGFLLRGSAISPEKEEIIKSLIYENTSLITNIQTRYFEQITGAVMRSIQSGLGVGHIEEELNKYRGMTKRRARNIALDQTRKAYNSINYRNMQDAGIKKAEWVHSGGSQKPRTYHQTRWDGVSGLKDGKPNGLNGFIFRLDQLPVIDLKTGQRGKPGDLPYCHCRMAAVVEFDLSTGMDSWKESEHPRDKDGKFTDGSGNGSSKQDKPKKPTPTIAGVKQGKPMSFKEANEGKVNPNFEKGEEYQNNCQICTLTFELRIRGYDIEAVPFNKSNPDIIKLAKEPWSAYKDTNVLSSPAKNYVECKEWLKDNIKRGERYTFGYRPGINSSKHVIRVQKNILGDIEFYDPQSGEKLKTNETLRDAFMCKRLGLDAHHFPPIIFKTNDKELDEDLINNIFKRD